MKTRVYAALVGLAIAMMGDSASAAEPAAKQGAKAPAAAVPAENAAPAAITPDVAAKAAAATPLVLLLRDDGVRRELRLTPKQIAAVDTALNDVQGQLWYHRDLKDAEGTAGRGRVYDHLRTAFAAAGEPSQETRLNELLLQVRGWRGVRLEPIVSTLDLSDGQLSRIDKLLDPAEGAPPEGPLPDALEKSLMAVLNPQQRKLIPQALGPAYDLSKLPTRHCPAPKFEEITEWTNSEPLDLDQLRGKVVVVHFWAFGCINCIRNIPHYESWYQKFKDRDVVIVGIHTPETMAERELAAVRSKVAENKMQYPIAIDGAGRTWTAWANAWWPSVYLIDKRGYVRYWWYGELNWQDAKGEELMRGRIDALLTETE